ncbi:hypothetical protein HPO96_13940 [Kribbella sandramycini]|uniref:Heparinase II/III-like C-terminal domain-containing protein n=1 Tax=Kribbella sandramycini TaxID=60450 RepID=A0A7Y4KZ58_9ACTN|nr:heparinase II/III family protein [Kribbella sandramycini]MBB6565078.1 hypothetical protein [Kribbella sandramycini]NOL41349.1 hypothetical protein [Kribbella sandramycini]
MNRLGPALVAGAVLIGTLLVPGRVSESKPGPAPRAAVPQPQSAPTAKALGATYACPTYSGIERPNPLRELYRDRFTWGTSPAYQVGNGRGNVSWQDNPTGNPSWYMWLHSLRWLGQGIRAAGSGDMRALQRVDTIAQDWVRDNPFPWRDDAGAAESTMHRTNVLICLRQAVLSGRRATQLPAAYRWIDKALTDHARFLQRHWSGDWNHGTDESLALFGVGCTLGRAELKQLAVDRLAVGLRTAIDVQGSTNEQSTSYAQYNYSLWGRAIAVLERCGVDPGPAIRTRRTQMASWLALATNSLGYLHQLGDSEVVRTTPVVGTPLEYAGTLGQRGKRPTQRVGIFAAGYVFGRTGWGERRPFDQESTYSIRFGPQRRLHGHDDHMSVTYTSLGRDILVDGGHPGYVANAVRTWASGPTAHNVMTVSGTALPGPATKLERSVVRGNSEYYRLSDTLGGVRTRDVLVLKDPDLMIVLDRGSSRVSRSWETLWHLPADQQVTLLDRYSATAQRPGDNRKTVLLQIPDRQRRTPAVVDSAWHYRTINHRSTAPVLKFSRSGRSASILTAIIPTKATTPVSYTQSATGLTLKVGQTTVRVAIGPDGTLRRLR